MKNFKLFLFISLISLTFSCSKDEENPTPTNSGEIIGVWKGTTVNYTGSSTTTVQGQSTIADYIGEGYDVNYTLTFIENTKKFVSDGSFSIELTGTVNGQTFTQNVENQELIPSGDWSVNGKTLSFIIDNETDDATIVELTNNTLILNLVKTETNTDSDFTVTSTSDVTISFIKQ